MKLKVERVVVREHDVNMSGDGTGIHIEIDNITVASISTNGHMRVYFDRLRKLDIEADIFGTAKPNESGGARIVDMKELFIDL